ncbi:hypothetical protein C1752_07900 [Acaryochloris thomasi RCC1774]|uniref:RRM domain-containing protein n=1 Tax=Acaryochloris thomasi RCC1774 TaxID=1764569 RepID=A0A2W1JJE8_9CYAN|nr:RNA-binding protein [Acaryochloris thomasi]PZD71172.1 hypothetical protein C1752_07900 [Acaryochloris thomasi RCC1774]
MSIYISNLSFKATATDINNVFSDYGTIKGIHIPQDRETGRSRGFAFVEMERAKEDSAIKALNGIELMERALTVNKARPKVSRDLNNR